jgi:ATP-dependent DNA ligase
MSLNASGPHRMIGRTKATGVRCARLQALLARAKSDLLRFSETFHDANALLAGCSRRGLEGIVAKRKDVPTDQARAAAG